MDMAVKEAVQQTEVSPHLANAFCVHTLLACWQPQESWFTQRREGQWEERKRCFVFCRSPTQVKRKDRARRRFGYPWLAEPEPLWSEWTSCSSKRILSTRFCRRAPVAHSVWSANRPSCLSHLASQCFNLRQADQKGSKFRIGAWAQVESPADMGRL